MEIIDQTLILTVTGLIAGLIGSLSGLGGGVVLVPSLILLGYPVKYATGSSLISTIATSSGAASAYVKDRISNIRIGITLEIGTTTGSIVGSLLAAKVNPEIIEIILGIVLIFSSFQGFFLRRSHEGGNQDKLSKILKLSGSYFDEASGRTISYQASNYLQGLGVMFLAGVISGLLGIGSGALKVIGMDLIMGLPIKVSTTTSNFMIGVTAAAGSGIYWHEGLINPYIASFVAIGVLLGSYIGSKTLVRMRGGSLRLIFSAVVLILGIEMILRSQGWI
jgi:Predicted permeases